MSDQTDQWWDFQTGDVERDKQNLRIVMETVRELYTALDADERKRRAVDRAIEVTGAERGILLIEKDGELVPEVARNSAGQDLDTDLRYSRSNVESALTKGEIIRTIGPEDEKAGDITHSMIDIRLVSLMAVPLRFGDRLQGVLYLDATYARKDFTDNEKKVLRTLSGLISAALENARLEVARAERDRIQTQIVMARDVQRRLVPTDIAEVAGFQLAGEGRVCEAMSGDYYDVIPRPDGCVCLVVGDVSGHGIGQALYMAMTRALLHLLMEENGEAQVALGKLNDFLERNMSAATFMSLFLAVLDPTTGSLLYASAGHNPPLLHRAGGGIEELERTGPILGAMPGVQFRASAPIQLAPGDVLTLYTDGIYEARDGRDEMYGEDRFTASLERQASAGLDAKGILAGLLEDLDGFRGPQPLEDDITCLVVKAV